MWTDGACKGNPGVGGWGAWMKFGDHERELSGGSPLTTNNQMELTAVIEGLKALKQPCAVTLHVDSTYVMKGAKEWMAGWKKKGWVRMEGGKKKPVKNVELWQELDQLVAKHEVSYHHVRGHSGHPEYERCVVMAVEASQNYF